MRNAQEACHCSIGREEWAKTRVRVHVKTRIAEYSPIQWIRRSQGALITSCISREGHQLVTVGGSWQCELIQTDLHESSHPGGTNCNQNFKHCEYLTCLFLWDKRCILAICKGAIKENIGFATSRQTGSKRMETQRASSFLIASLHNRECHPYYCSPI